MLEATPHILTTIYVMKKHIFVLAFLLGGSGNVTDFDDPDDDEDDDDQFDFDEVEFDNESFDEEMNQDMHDRYHDEEEDSMEGK